MVLTQFDQELSLAGIIGKRKSDKLTGQFLHQPSVMPKGKGTEGKNEACLKTCKFSIQIYCLNVAGNILSLFQVFKGD